jgi:hypothetical protein
LFYASPGGNLLWFALLVLEGLCASVHVSVLRLRNLMQIYMRFFTLFSQFW